jgi:phage shock protein PspC (stress-responsive transcriptional regulator)
MKKTISINISGQVFNIEEDSYDKLKQYLGAITKYFSTYGDSKEILTDIEGRIAEKFLDYLKKEDKQAISAENVDSIIASMGSVSDFEAIKEEEDMFSADPKTDIENAANEIKATSDTSQTTGEGSYKTSSAKDASAPKRIYRDSLRKIIGGVCAGYAHYFRVDPVWIRLLFLACISLAPLAEPLGGIIMLLYIASWIAFPANNELKEDEKIKKFFRDPDKKVLAGVVAGVSKYIGMDLGLLRLLFVLAIPLGGAGIIIYLIIWAVAPFAKTITDKMQMKGQPITLENIETNIKTANSYVPKAESAIATVLLFPFRLIGKIFSAIGPLFQFALVGVRIFAGLLLSFIGIICLLALVAALFSSWGAFGDFPIATFGDVPLNLVARDAPRSLFFFGFFASAIPFLVLALAGFSLVSKKNIFNSVIVQTLGGLWIMGIFGAGMAASKYANNFKRFGTYEKIQTITTPGKTPTLDISDNEGWGTYNDVSYRLEVSNEADIQVLQKFEAYGPTEEQAQKNAQSIEYKITQTDSLLIFKRNLELGPTTNFRKQELKTTINIPKDKIFYITRQFAADFDNFDIDWNNVNWDIKANKVKGHAAARFKFDNNGNLEIIDKEENAKRDDEGTYTKEYSFDKFNSLELNGNIIVEIEEGNQTSVIARAINENSLDNLKLSMNDETIKTTFLDNDDDENDEIILKITMPNIQNIKLEDQANVTIRNISSKKINIKLKNNSALKIEGKTEKLNLELRDQSTFKGANLKAEKVDITSHNQSSAKVKAINSLKAEANDESEIEYIGKPIVLVKSTNNQSTISKISEEDIED